MPCIGRRADVFLANKGPNEHRDEHFYDLDLHHGVRTAFYTGDCGQLVRRFRILHMA